MLTMAPNLTLLSDLTPPSLERTWLTAPHPTLPLVATCSSDKTVRVYSLTNFKLLSTITGGHKRSVRTCAWKPHVQGESVLATGSFDATVGIWRRWDSYGRVGVMVAVGMLLATCARDKSIWIWEDLDDGDNNFETVAVMQEHGGDVKCVSWHPVEECLASGGYDDTIRLWREDLDDWGQVACIKKHEGTVWALDWEGPETTPHSSEQSLQAQWREQRALSGPRLVSCSDDRTVRIWRRLPKESALPSTLSSAATGIPSIIRPTGTDETWEEDAVLPQSHALVVYSVAWSHKSGLLASVGADGRIVVYEERLVASTPDTDAMDTESESRAPLKTEWVILAVVNGAHGIYEINHVAWAKRADRGSSDGEEVLITTADDGSVKVWTLQP
ncbi:hypothetical protein N7468_000137 [Penicillium chermesinum]|uniref:Probable cytosolic iron-sulfur protein assembly protein 1 n=1 Tax=Penicillium chermesinum TaxID=63820 RepID=A0A9W9PJP3_9EURO|nr:uncharacterized protein N7468_000137 [Penicillium chermesinum]KAJ5248686.1 hypothetical protein N7468_000137 [Penicillium chermesinum]